MSKTTGKRKEKEAEVDIPRIRIHLSMKEVISRISVTLLTGINFFRNMGKNLAG